MSELITNGSFDTWATGLPTGWEKLGVETITQETTDVVSGSAVKISTVGGTSGIRQKVLGISGGQRCKITVAQHVDTAGDTGQWRLGLELQLTGGELGGKFLNFTQGKFETETIENEKHLVLYSRPLTGRYVTIGYEFQMPQTGNLYVILKRVDAGHTYSCYIDNISLQTVSTPVVPTSIDWGETQRLVPDQIGLLDSFISSYGKPDYIGFYREFSKELLTANDITTLTKYGITPVISWEPEEGTDKPTLKEILEGKWNTYIDAQAAIVKAYEKTVIVRPYYEMNIGTLFPTQMNSTEYVAMWQFLVERFKAKGVTNVKWLWCPVIDYDRGESNFEGFHDFFVYFPGDTFVDYVGADGYSTAYYDTKLKQPTWSRFEQIFLYTYNAMMGVSSKPFFVGETGVQESGGSKASWFYDWLTIIPNRFPRLAGLVYFNRHNPGEPEWEIGSSGGSDLAFRAVISDPLYSNMSSSPPKNVIVHNSYPPDDLGITVTTPTGRVVRWGGDEPLPENVVGNLSILTEIPGGFKELTGTLNRDPQRSWPELQPYSEVEVYLPSGRRVFEGYLDKAPDVSGGQASISPSALGYQSMMEDNKAIQIGFINQDNTAWGSPSALRLKALLESAYLPSQVTVTVGFQDTGPSFGAGVFFTYDQQKQAGKHPIGESWWYGGGIDLGQIYTDAVTPKAGSLGSEQHNIVSLTKDDNGGSGIAGADAGSGTQTQNIVSASGAGFKYALLQSRYDGEGFTGEFGGDTYGRTHITILGYPALTLQGTWPNVGLKARDMLVQLFERFGGGLTAKAGNIEDDGYTILQAWYADPSTLADIAKDLIKYGWYDWFFYRGKEFEYRKPFSYGRVWKTTVAASNLNEVGTDSSRTWNSVVVQWTDVDGSIRTAGPVGSGCRIESSSLEINSSRNAADAAGRNRRALLSISGAITETTAIELGIRFLEESELIDRSGSMTLSGYVMDEKGYYHPVSEVRAGDWIEPVDAHDHSPRKIVHTNYNHAQKENELDLDAPASGMDALLERLAAGLIPLGVG